MSSARLKAKVKPELLIWARKTARFSVDVAAAKAQVPPADLQQWEAGQDLPSLAQLRRLAEVYKRPIVVFYLPAPPQGFDALHDFRRLPVDAVEESPELAAEIRWAHEMRDVALEAFRSADIEISQFVPGKRDGTATEVARSARKTLGVSIVEQQSWTDGYKAFNRWRESIEMQGVLCLQFSHVQVSEARAFSIGETLLPVIAVNTKDAISARCFSLLHEFAHLILGQAGKCNLRDSADVEQVEVFCNAVAAEILVPEGELRNQPDIRGARSPQNWSDTTLTALARQYRVSQEVILRRLLDMGLTSDAFYRQRRDAYLAFLRAQVDKDESGGNYYVNLRSKLGTPIIRGVLAAYHAGQLTANEAAAYLRVKVESLYRLQEHVA